MSSSPPGGGAARADLLVGLAWAFAAAILHSMIPVGVRLLSDHMPSIEIVFLRNVIGFSIFGAYFAWAGFGRLRVTRPWLHVQRNVVNFAGMWLWFAALGMMPMSKAIALHFTEPMFATLLAVLLLGERPGWRRFVALAAGIVGVLIILRPGAIPVSWASVMVLASAGLYGLLAVITRVVGRTDPAAVTTFYYQGMLSLFALPLALWGWVWPVWSDLPGILIIAVAGTGAPYCIIRALRHAEASAVSPTGYLRLPLTAAFGFLLFAEPTEIWTWAGGAVIVAGTLFMTHGETRARRKD